MSQYTLAEWKKAFKSRRMVITLITIVVVFVVIVGMHLLKDTMIHKRLDVFEHPIVTVSAVEVGYDSWQPQYEASASLRAVMGVNVTTETAGMVRDIHFKPGQDVKKGDLLVQLDIDNLNAQLQSYQATAHLDKVTYERDKAQYAIKAVSKQTLDNDLANWQSAQAQVGQQQAVIAKSTITAPFDGRLGICLVSPGQYINTGDGVTSLQTYNPIYADFYVPQEVLPRLKMGQVVKLRSDAFPKQTFNGTITTLNSSFDSSSRNVEIEATIANPDASLVPNMYATVTVDTGAETPHLTLPQAAVSFNSYGSIVYLLKETDAKDPSGKTLYSASQKFIGTGETRGDQVVIKQGLRAGDLVVTSGQLKLKNGSQVVISNVVVPADNAVPTAADGVDQ